MKKILSLILAYFFLALAIVGVFLPGLPTVPFLLLTAWFAARGSDKLHAWLYAHPHFGKLLIDWEERGAISRTSKVLAIVMLVVSWCIMFFSVSNIWVPIIAAVCFMGTATFILTRPE
ncbi:YbaN family protein [Aurantivibrio plasticivorans]